MIKAVLLDVDNTLLDFDLSADKAIKDAFCALSIEYSANVLPTFIRVNDGLWRRIETAEITRAELHRIRWDIVFSELGVKADGRAMESLFLKNLQNTAIPVEGATDAVKYLSGKYKLFTASNAPYPQQVNRLKIAGLYPFIDGIMNFEREGVHKPQTEFFVKCLKALEPIKREETAIIGDSLSADIKGGKDVGITTVWFDRKKTEQAASALSAVDIRITDLADIKKVL